MTNTPFFILQGSEVHPLALLCVSMTESMMQKEDTKKTARLEGRFLEAFHRLRDKLYSMKDEQGEAIREDVPLDAEMSFAMMHSIIQPFYRMKGHLMLPKEKQNPDPEKNEEIEELYTELKDDAADLLLRLTKQWNYLDYGLQALEEVFEITPAVRPLKVDDKTVITSYTLNEHNTRLFQMVFTWLDTLETFRSHYEFARKFYACQYLHISDYRKLRDKLHPLQPGRVIEFTLWDMITLYVVLSLFGRMFVSDAADLFDDIGKESDAKSRIATTSKDVRSFFLKFADKVQTDTRTIMQNHPSNDIFLHYIERFNSM